MSYSERLKTLRGDIPVDDIVNALGITKSSWYMYERGERIPRAEVMIKIANYFGKSVQDIFFASQVHSE